MRKPKKVEVLEGAFDSIPEAEREEVMKAVLENLKNIDLDDLSGQRVLAVPPGTTACPRCEGQLVVATRVRGDVFLDCESCEAMFMTEAQ